MKGTSIKEPFSRMIVWLAAIVFLMACNSQSDKPYSIAMQGNNLYITMPYPTSSLNEYGQIDWHGVELSDVVEDIFKELQSSDFDGDCSLYARFETNTTDKYGYTQSKYDEKFIVSIPISEAKKYKDAEHLDSNYSIRKRINELASPTSFQEDFSNLHWENVEGTVADTVIVCDPIIENSSFGSEQNKVTQTDTVAATIVFFPQNAIIVDEQGSHNFEHFDCPNMNVTDDNGKRVVISWGGDKVILYKSANNDDTYSATGNTSRGNLTLRAFRSSSSGQIYLVTATMPNPSTDVKFITINFKH